MFLSYSSHDRDYVERLAAYLAAEGVSCWFDKEIEVGDHLSDVIQDRIASSVALVVVQTPAAMKSQWVDREIGYARRRNKPVLPIRLAGSPDHILLVDVHYEEVDGDQLPGARFVSRLRDLIAQRSPEVTRRPVLGPTLRTLLRAQRVRAEELPYRVLLQGPQPPLSAVYVEQRATRYAAHHVKNEEGSEERAKAKALAGDSVGVETVVRTVAELLRSERHALVVGEPGTGKSTLLQHLVGESANWWLSTPVEADTDAAPFGPVLPVRVSASTLVGRPLREALTEGINAELGTHLDRSFTADMFTGPPATGVAWLILVDGLDEIMDSRTRTLLIGALAERLTQHGSVADDYRFLVTSRPLPEQELAPLRTSGVGDWRLRPFDPHDLEVFAGGWFRARGASDVDKEAREFLARVERSHLQAIVRIPLLAVITAIVHEHSGERDLPIGQTGLYADFLRYLLQIRQEAVRARQELSERLSLYTPSGPALTDWLFEHLLPLLGHLATEFLCGRADSLASLAAKWTAEHCPELPRQVPDWADRVTDLLRGTGILLEQDGTLRFLHQSFADYLAAGPAAENLVPAAWRGLILNPARRNQALFTLARWAEQPGHDPTLLVEPLLRQRDDDDLLAAAAVLAHGITLAPSTESAIVDALLAAAHGTHGGHDFLGALRALPGRPIVTDGVASLMTNPAVAVSTRVEAARSHAALTDPAPAVSALTAMATDPHCPAAERIMVAQALDDLGERTAATDILAKVMHDSTVNADDRVSAAQRLADRGDPSAAHEVLHGIAHDPAVDDKHRIRAAHALGDLGELGAALRLMTEIMNNPHSDLLARIWAAKRIARLGSPRDAITALLAMVHDSDTTAFHRGVAARGLADLNERTVAINVLVGLGRDPIASDFERVLAAEELIAIGERAEALAILTPIARRGDKPGWDQTQAARALAAAGDRDVAIGILLRLAHDARAGGQTRLAAARELASLGKRADATALLKRLTHSWRRTASNRAYAAHSLASLGELAYARTALRRIATAWYVSGRSRAIAAGYLVDLGERDLALTVLSRITGGGHFRDETRVDAARELANLGEREPALAVLRQVAGSSSKGVLSGYARTAAAQALAALGERHQAIDILIELIRFTPRDSLRVWAASELVDIGERETARRELTNIVHDPRATPDNRLIAAQELSREWGESAAATLLIGVANQRRTRTRNRIRAAMDLAKFHNKELAVTTLRSIAANNRDDPVTRLAATAVLTRWKLRHPFRNVLVLSVPLVDVRPDPDPPGARDQQEHDAADEQ